MIFNLNEVVDISLDIRRRAVFHCDTALFDLTLELERIAGKICRHIADKSYTDPVALTS